MIRPRISTLARHILFIVIVGLVGMSVIAADTPPQNLSPHNQIVVNSPDLVFTWSAVLNTTTYKFILKSAGATYVYKHTLLLAEANCTDTVCSYAPNDSAWLLQHATTYSWKIVASGTYETTDKLKSTKTTFVTDFAIPSRFALTSPTHGGTMASGTVPTFTWQAAMYADTYKLTLTDPAGVVIVNTLLDASLCVASCAYTPSSGLVDLGAYTLKIKAKNPYGKTKAKAVFTVYTPTVAATYYVDQNHPSASDSNPGTLDLPWLTLQHAAATVIAGDTVYIRAGTYNEILKPVNAGSAGAPITYAAYAGETVILDGTGITFEEYWSGVIWLDHVNYITISGLQVMNSESNAILSYFSEHIIIHNNYTYNSVLSGIGVWDSGYVLVDGNEVELANNDGEQENISISKTHDFEVRYNHVHDGGPGTNGGEGIDTKQGANNGRVYGNVTHNLQRLGIYVDAWDRHTYNIEVFNNLIYNNDAYGLALVSESGGLLENIRVYNNIIYGNKYGIGIWDCCTDLADHHPLHHLYIYNNTIYNNSFTVWGGGISVENAEIQDVIIVNNLVSNNDSFQIMLDSDLNIPLSEITISHNLINGFQNEDGEVLGDYAVQGDPLFVDLGANNVHITSSSPAIDTGNCAGAPAFDFDDQARPIDGDQDGNPACDIGVYEFND